MEGRSLIKGTRGGWVPWLQGCLKNLGYYNGTISGVYDALTEKAVQSFQKAHYLEEDGVLGPQTKIVLYHALKVYPMPTLISHEVKGEGILDKKENTVQRGRKNS